MSEVSSIIEVSPNGRYEMKKFDIRATYEYVAEGIIAENEDAAYNIFLANLNDHYSGTEELEIEEDGDVCENCEEDIDDCECEDEDE
jgi:hypothetical protein